jgi:hypothetical protein
MLACRSPTASHEAPGLVRHRKYHVAQVRLATLAANLPRHLYDVHFACSDFDPRIFDGIELERWKLFTIDEEQGFKALGKGERMYDVKTLERYVAEE